MFLQLSHWAADAASMLLMVVTLNHRLFRRFALWPQAWLVLGLAALGVGIEAAAWFAHLDQAGWLGLAWDSLALLLNAGFVIAVFRRLLLAQAG